MKTNKGFAITPVIIILALLVVGGAYYASKKLKPSITVLSPNGGETIKIGQSYTIKWDASDFSQSETIHIFLSDDSTCLDHAIGCWSSFGIGSAPNTGNYVWDTTQKMFGDAGPNSTPVFPGNNYKILLDVRFAGDNSIDASDYSNRPFVIIK